MPYVLPPHKVGELRFQCPDCSGIGLAPEEWKGSDVRCAHCRHLFSIPKAYEIPPRPPEEVTTLHKWALSLAVASVFLYWIGIVPIAACTLAVIALVTSKNQRQTVWALGSGALSAVFLLMYLQHYGHLK